MDNRTKKNKDDEAMEIHILALEQHIKDWKSKQSNQRERYRHEWGDGWEGWKILRDAEKFISEMFMQVSSGYYLCSKEKYGNIVYEHIAELKDPGVNFCDREFFYVECAPKYLRKRLALCIAMAIYIYPSISDEIINDLEGTCDYISLVNLAMKEAIFPLVAWTVNYGSEE